MTYREPIEKFLSIGRPNAYVPEDWLNYVQEYSLTNEHIPDLIQIMLDNSGDDFQEPENYAAIHAWRSLAQLKAVEGIPAMIEVLRRDIWEEWGWEEIPQVLGLIGETAIEPVYDALRKRRNTDETSTLLISSLERIAEHHPHTQEAIIARFEELLSEPTKNDSAVNGFLIAALLNFKSAKSIDVIEAAYKSKHVDLMICGTFRYVLQDFGLPIPDEFDEEEYGERFIPPLFPFSDYEQEPIILSEKAYEKKKKKRQMAKKSKQINRKKKKK